MQASVQHATANMIMIVINFHCDFHWNTGWSPQTLQDNVFIYEYSYH